MEKIILKIIVNWTDFGFFLMCIKTSETNNYILFIRLMNEFHCNIINKLSYNFKFFGYVC